MAWSNEKGRAMGDPTLFTSLNKNWLAKDFPPAQAWQEAWSL
jgi:hypothetical protein